MMLLFARGMDLLSTWLATPHLVLEANPLARRLGWRGGLAVNATLSLVFACWPVVAISLTTTSLLVAARNLQQCWLMRSMGEAGYRMWFSDRVARAPKLFVWACYLGEAAFTGLIGGALLWFSKYQLVPFGVGLGILGYALAVAIFTSLSLWRARY
jgi:hypothetical protein